MIDEKILLKALRGFYEREQEYKLVSDEKGIHYEPQTGLIDEIIKYVQKMPKVGEWIPCSERLPKYTSNYLVTVMIGSPFGSYKEVRSAIYNTKTGWCVYESADEIANVIAWAESPEPWKGEEQNDTTRD